MDETRNFDLKLTITDKIIISLRIKLKYINSSWLKDCNTLIIGINYIKQNLINIKIKWIFIKITRRKLKYSVVNFKIKLRKYKHIRLSKYWVKLRIKAIRNRINKVITWLEKC